MRRCINSAMDGTFFNWPFVLRRVRAACVTTTFDAEEDISNTTCFNLEALGVMEWCGCHRRRFLPPCPPFWCGLELLLFPRQSCRSCLYCVRRATIINTVIATTVNCTGTTRKTTGLHSTVHVERTNSQSNPSTFLSHHLSTVNNWW